MFRMEMQQIISNLRDPKDEKEVILLPITTRLKAASLPPIEDRRPVQEKLLLFLKFFLKLIK